jgi:hypothetical protein
VTATVRQSQICREQRTLWPELAAKVSKVSQVFWNSTMATVAYYLGQADKIAAAAKLVSDPAVRLQLLKISQRFKVLADRSTANSNQLSPALAESQTS